MSKLLSSDFYRLFKSKSFYICTGVSLILVALNIFLLDWANSLLEEGNQIISELPDGITYGMSAFSNNNVVMILSVFTAIFVTADFSHGTMKNVISKGFSKLQVYFSKVITMVAASFIIILSTLLVGTVSATIVTGSFGNFTASNIAIIFKNSGIELLLNTALASVFVMIAMVIRNLGGTIAVNIFGITMIGPMMFQVAEVLTHGKIKFTEFSLLFNISSFQMNAATGMHFLRSAIVGIVFLVISFAFGVFVFRKSDVK